MSDQVAPVTAVRKVFLLIEAVAYGRRDIIFYVSVGYNRRYPFCLCVCLCVKLCGKLVEIIYGGYRWS